MGKIIDLNDYIKTIEIFRKKNKKDVCNYLKRLFFVYSKVFALLFLAAVCFQIRQEIQINRFHPVNNIWVIMGSIFAGMAIMKLKPRWGILSAVSMSYGCMAMNCYGVIQVSYDIWLRLRSITALLLMLLTLLCIGESIHIIDNKKFWLENVRISVSVFLILNATIDMAAVLFSNKWYMAVTGSAVLLMGFVGCTEPVINGRIRSVLRKWLKWSDHSNMTISNLYQFQMREFIFSGQDKELRSIVKKIAQIRKIKVNPLILYGESGCGKSFLCKSILNEAIKKWGGCAYFTGSAIIDAMVSGMKYGSRMEEFYSVLADMDIVVIDEIEDLYGKPSAQKALVRLVNWLTKQGTQVIISGISQDTERNQLHERLLDAFPEAEKFELHIPEVNKRRRYVEDILRYSGIRVKKSVREKIVLQRNLAVSNSLLNILLNVNRIFPEYRFARINDEMAAHIFGRRYSEM